MSPALTKTILCPGLRLVRVTLQALAAILGGTQSLHTNSLDEALSLPSKEAAQLALRCQQILARESGITDVVDPLGGSPYIEAVHHYHRPGSRSTCLKSSPSL